MFVRRKPKGRGGPRRTTTIWALAVAAVIAGALIAAAPGPAVTSVSKTLAAVDPDQVTFTLEGCRNNGGITLPNGNGDFICADSAYTTGNLGKNWSELDLVPFRVTTDLGSQAGATTDYTIAIALDYIDSGHTGYDFISAATTNAGLSDSSCSITSGPQQTTGGSTSIYRLITIHQSKGTTCVFDFYGRLALGSSLYPGASLHANLFNQSLGESGVGSKEVSILVNEIAPQELDKDMGATQDSDHAWTLTKGATPATKSIANTCDPNAALSVPVSVKIEWAILPAAGSGQVTVITHVYATNPASRSIDISVTDVIKSGTTTLETAGPTAFATVPANTTNFLVLTHTLSIDASQAVDLNDVATGTYRDTVTQITIPQTTTDTASATVQPSGVELNQTADIADVESISGSGFSYTVNGSPSPVAGTFDAVYTYPTTGNVGWHSGTQSANGSTTFSKTVSVAAGTDGTGTLSDTATLNGFDGFTVDADASTVINATRLVKLTIDKSISGAVFATAQSFTFHIYDSTNAEITSTTVTVPAGQTTGSATVSGLQPDTYTVTEEQRTGFAPVDTPPPVDITTGCSGSVSFTNGFSPAKAAAKKITTPAGSEAGWEMKLTDVTDAQNPVLVGTTTTSGTSAVTFTSSLVDGHHYTITETNQTGWDAQAPTGDCNFTVTYPGDAGKTFTCTFTNVKRGSITVKKVTDPTSATDKFTFTGDAAGDIGNAGTIGPVSVAPGTYYSTEAAKSGWDLTAINCSDSDSTGSTSTRKATFIVAAGENVTCTFNNRQRGHLRVVKTISGANPPATNTTTFTFTLRTGATPIIGNPGTVLETKTISAQTTWLADFATDLVPGATYQICEQLPSAGWSLTFVGYTQFVPEQYLADGVTLNPVVDNSLRCANFTVSAGQLKSITVDNAPPPGGLALTIGYWKNWSSCSGGKQTPKLDQTLASFPGGGVQLGKLFVNTCPVAVSVLNKSDIKNGKKMSSDPLYNMAAQLLAVELNLQSGSATCPNLSTKRSEAQAFLNKYSWNGTGTYTYPKGSTDPASINALATFFDKYNNDLLC
jgi:hypothetical protein